MTSKDTDSITDSTVKKDGDQIKLIYFDAKGAVEVTRVMLKIKGIEFEDKRYPLTFEKSKPEAVEFAADKKKGFFKANLNRLPLMVFNGTKVAQSKTIERFIANKCGFAGSTLLEGALIDSVCEHLRDVNDAYQKIRKADCDMKEELLNKWFETDLKEWLQNIEDSLIANSDTGYLIGDKMSLADLRVWNLATQYFDEQEKVTEIFKAFPKLLAASNKCSENETLQQWLKDRPLTKF